MRKRRAEKSKVIKSIPEKIVFGIVFVLFFIYALAILYFFYFAFSASLKESGRAFIKDMISFPIPPHFENFITAFKELNLYNATFWTMTMNSVIYTCGMTFLGMFSSSMAAYVVAKYNFKLKNVLYTIAIIVMIIPIYGSLPAQYKLLSDLHMTDSYLYILSCTGGLGYNFILIYSFFRVISWDYAEAAFIDGAGHFFVFFRIMLPMALPAITALIISSFVANWNNYANPILFYPNHPTLASGIFQYQQKISYMANEPVYFAGVLISLIPPVALFIAFQDTLMNKVYAGGLKG